MKRSRFISAAKQMGNAAPKKRRSVGGTAYDLTSPVVKPNTLTFYGIAVCPQLQESWVQTALHSKPCPHTMPSQNLKPIMTPFFNNIVSKREHAVIMKHCVLLQYCPRITLKLLNLRLLTTKRSLHVTKLLLPLYVTRVGLNLNFEYAHAFFMNLNFVFSKSMNLNLNLNFVFSKSMNLNILIKHSTNLFFFDLELTKKK